MYPNLYFAFYELFGIDLPFLKLVNSFGFFVALAFIAASMTLSRELKRKEEQGLLKGEKRKVIVGKKATPGEIASSTIIGFIFGFKFVWLGVNASEIFRGDTLPQEHIFSFDGSLLWGIIMAAAFGGWRWYESKRNALDKPEEREETFHVWQNTGNITLVAAIGGIVGAKLFHLFENPDEFMQFFKNPSLESFLGGLTIYGGLIMGTVACYIYARKKGIKFIHLADAAAPGLMLAYGIGRVGCQVSGDGDWGIPNTADKPGWLSWLPDWAWSYSYPNNVNGILGPRSAGYTGKTIPIDDPACAAELANPLSSTQMCEGMINGESVSVFKGYGTYLDPGVFPTPLYEVVMALIIFAILWSLRKRIKIPGMIFAIYLIFNGFERFWIEKIRVNSTYQIFGTEITQAEIISTIIFLGGIFMALYLKRKHNGSSTPSTA
ncbi:prolipoprotein diacylglyceryl transferase [Sanyastnella coralliicola]|uniref:prolipoprotein diacylglyceryl transferase n=1 Tax=Sanyastnella coralliicola TaxID=3069118 RepID=UPI0027B8CDD9|nr:prolipoprotein diacylglyceryl transferase family protein [Longitalea sp. SCSIO 12813]